MASFSTAVLNLDRSFESQQILQRAPCLPMRHWSRTLRMACRFRTFTRFQKELDTLLDRRDRPRMTFIGSGDFHHATLALLNRIETPINLLVLDNHPDWMRGIPFLHCGTWLYHAAKLPNVRRIFHVGGDVDFDNHYRWMAPWPYLRSGKIVVVPAVRRFHRGRWSNIRTDPLRHNDSFSLARLLNVLHPYRAELRQAPLYISVDKDVLTASEAVVNWDSGHLSLDELTTVLESFIEAARGRLGGFDTVGDWSPVVLEGISRHLLHWSEHPHLSIDPVVAARRNDAVNRRLLDILGASTRAPGKTSRLVLT